MRHARAHESALDYERRAFEQIDALKNPERSRARAAFDRLQAPVVNAAASALDNRVGALSARLVQALIEKLDETASWSVRSGAIYTAFAEAGCAVEDAHGIHGLELCEVDRVVDGLDAKSEWLALATGAGAGALGLAGAALDIPGLVGIALRTITAYATYYGFDPSIDDEKALSLLLLATASAMTFEHRQAAMKEVSKVSLALSSGDPRIRSQRLLSMRMMTSVSATLGARFVRDKPAQAVPLLGAVVGAATDAWFVRTVARITRQIDRERWLIAKHGPAVAVPVRE
jgi:hypothetical protein